MSTDNAHSNHGGGLLARTAASARAIAHDLRPADRTQALHSVEKELKRLSKQVDAMAKEARAEEKDGIETELGRLDYAGAPIYMTLGSKHERKRLRSSVKEPWTIEWIERWFRPGETLYDIGANVGAYTLIAGKLLQGHSQVVSLEPSYSTYKVLCDNVLANGLDGTVTALPIAVGNETGLGQFILSDVRAGAASHHGEEDPVAEGGRPFQARRQAAFRQPVLTYRLDDLLPQLGLPAPTHLKLDVDGAEIAVLEGAERTLASPELKSLIVEVDEATEENLVSRLEAAGLPLQQRYERNRPKDYWYGLFARNRNP